MGLAIEQWLGLLCMCAFGIQNSFSFIAEQREMRSECTKNIGHFCINVIPPPPPKKRRMPGKAKRRGWGGKRRGAARGQGRVLPTKTRRGRRPSAAELGARNNVLPASANRQPAYQPRPVQQPRYVQPPPYVAQWVPPVRPTTPAPNYGDWLFGSLNWGNFWGTAPAAGGTPQNNAANNAIPWHLVVSRKKRQAAEPLEPGDHGYTPRIRRGQKQYDFLNMHCHKTEISFNECRSTGGVCCQPRP